MNDNTSDRYERGGPHDPDAERYGPQLDDLLEEELRNLRAEGRKTPKPKPTGNVCAFCVPVFVPEPTGRVRLRHSVSCPDKPGKPIHANEYAKGRRWPEEWQR